MADVPYALEFQVVDGHDALGAPVEAVGGKGALEENGDHARLPVVAVDDVGVEADNRHCCENCLAEEDKALDVPTGGIAVRLVALEIIFIVDKVEVHTLIDIFHDTNVDIFHMLAIIHVEMADIAELTAVFPRNAGVVGENHTDIIVVVIQTFRKCAHNVCKTSGLDKGDAFGCSK